MTDKPKSKCCKNFEDSACPCLDQKTGERSCGGAEKKPENKGCGDCGCAPKPPQR